MEKLVDTKMKVRNHFSPRVIVGSKLLQEVRITNGLIDRCKENWTLPATGTRARNA